MKTPSTNPGPHAPSLAASFELVRPRLELVEKFISAQLASGPAPVPEAGAYVLDAGGKRLRPAILLAAAQAIGYSGGELDVRYGAIIEMIHTASLVHDDIIDSATVRRGRVTANHRWGNQLTVLLGDWLYLRAIDLALEVADIPAMRTLSYATTQMIEGEILGMSLQGTGTLTREQYLEITRRKTAELFAAACVLPTHFQPQFAPYRTALEEYGRNIGMCFQIVDDILDIVGSQQRLGKPVFSDLLEGKLTLPFILALPQATESERASVERVVISRQLGGVTPEQLRALLNRHGAVAEARTVAYQYGSRAVAALAALPPSSAVDALASAPRFVLDREF